MKSHERALHLMSGSNEKKIKRGINMLSKAHGGFKKHDEELKERKEYKGRAHDKELKHK